MKRILAVLFVALLANSCDDGDLISQEIDFSDIPMARCSEANTDILYKLDDRDALLLQITNLDALLPQSPTPADAPATIDLNGTTVRLVYRVYNGEPAATNICSSIQPPTPSIIEQWNAISGRIEITSIAVTEANTTEGFEGGQKITKMRHAIVIRDVIWDTPNNQIVDGKVEFGNYDKPFSAPDIAGLGENTFKCDDNLLYKRTANTAFTINIDPALLSTDVLNTPKTGVISDVSNQVTFKRFVVGSVDLSAPTFDFCADYPALAATAPETWNANLGVDGVSGIVEVTTTQIGLGYVHTIRLKNVTLTRSDGAFSFKIADDFLYGEISVE